MSAPKLHLTQTTSEENENQLILNKKAMIEATKTGNKAEYEHQTETHKASPQTQKKQETRLNSECMQSTLAGKMNKNSDRKAAEVLDCKKDVC